MATKIQNLQNYTGYIKCGEILKSPIKNYENPFVLKCFACDEIHFLLESFIIHIQEHCKDVFSTSTTSTEQIATKTSNDSIVQDEYDNEGAAMENLTIKLEDNLMEVMSPKDSIGTDVDITDNSTIKAKIISGVFKINQKRGRSKVWSIFGKIENVYGEEIPHLLACRSCRNIYKYNGQSTSNLVKHKCYILFANMEEKELSKKIEEGLNKKVDDGIDKKIDEGTKITEDIAIAKINVDTETKNNIAQIFTEWTVENCRPLTIVEDSGFVKVAEYLISVGAYYGRNVDMNSLLPQSSTISRNINKAYNVHFQKIKTEINSIKNIGFGLTSDLWAENYINKTYIALTIHYIKGEHFISRLLGIRTMEDENVSLKVNEILKEFDLNHDDKAVIVIDRNSDMTAAFCKNNHIFCIEQLLYSIMKKSIKEVTEVSELSTMCTKLVKYLNISGLNSTLKITLKNRSSIRWNNIYCILFFIKENWSEIVLSLKRNNENNRIDNINLECVSALIQFLEPFQETFKKMEEENNATIHLVVIYIYHLKRKCASNNNDLEMIKHLKEKMSSYLDSFVLQNFTIYHKVGIFLFPPAKKLLQFSEIEKKLIKDECKRIMRIYYDDLPEPAENSNESLSVISNQNSDLFSGFLDQQDNNYRNVEQIINTEILMYESLKTLFHDDFDILKWWNLHQKEFPLLYKVSCKILATPASCASSRRVFSVARNLILEETCSITSNYTSINDIMFLHTNIDNKKLQKELFNSSSN